VLGNKGDEPWTTIPKAVVQAKDLANTATGADRELMIAVQEYLRERATALQN